MFGKGVRGKKRGAGGQKTYNTRDSPVVTDPSTSLALTCLSMGERTGSRVFKWIWSYVLNYCISPAYQGHLAVFYKCFRRAALLCWFFYPKVGPQEVVTDAIRFDVQRLEGPKKV